MNCKPEQWADSLCPSNEGREWRVLPEFQGAYLVSSDGYVVSLPRTCPCGDKIRTVPGKRLKRKPVKDARGKVTAWTVRVCSLVHGRREATVGALMLEAFVGPSHGRVAHVKNGKTDDFRLDNLEWSTFGQIAKQAPAGYAAVLRSQRGSYSNVEGVPA